MDILNLSGYYFVKIEHPSNWKEPILNKCIQLGLKGTVLLSPEGINLFISGKKSDCESLLKFLHTNPLFQNILSPLKCQISHSDKQPFTRMLVKLKKEIITMKVPAIQPSIQARAPAVDPSTLARWINQGKDDAGKEIVLLDTRNAFEVDLGTFKQAVDWRLKKFSDFPEALKKHKNELANKTIITFCTGGIRCEKATLVMQASGLSNVYQLEGGILNYFAQQGGKHYHGDCFVFDYRTTLKNNLLPSATTQCFACREIVNEDSQKSNQYIAGRTCPKCFERYQASLASKQKIAQQHPK